MTHRSLWLAGSLGCVIIVGLVLRARPPTAQPGRTPPMGADVSSSTAAPASPVMPALIPGRPEDREAGGQHPSSLPLSERVNTTQAGLPAAPQRTNSASAAQTGDWDDPSLDPSMKREPPAPILPPEARPTRPAIEPSQAEWRRLHRNDDALAY